MKQIGRAGVGGQQKVKRAVVINIGVSRAPRHFRSSERVSSLCRHFLELAAAEIAEQVRRLGIADALLYSADGVFDMSVSNKNVGPAVVVVVEKETSEAESDQSRAAHFRLRSLVHEQPVAFVVVERDHLIGEVCDQDARVAAAIIVGGVHAHAGAGNAVFAESDAGWDAVFLEGSV